MKKRVIVGVLVTLLIILALSAKSFSPTGRQVLEFPPPPPIPDAEIEQITPNVTVPSPIIVPPPMPDTIVVPPVMTTTVTEDRLSAVESQTAQISEVSAQLGLLETQVASLQAAVEALSQPAPELQSPAYEGLTSLRDSTESWFKWSLSIGVLALLGVLGIISAQVFQRINLSEKTKRELKSYLDSYLQQGYLFDQLKEHLVSSGWDPKIIDAVAKELKVKQ